MWVKTTCCCRLCLLLIIRKSIYNIVLVQTHTSMQASLVLQLLLEGSYNPLTLVLANMFTSTQAATYKRLRPSFFLQGPRFINFQTESINKIKYICINQSLKLNHHYLNMIIQKTVTKTQSRIQNSATTNRNN